MDEVTQAGAVRGRGPGGRGLCSHLAAQQTEVWSQAWTGGRKSEFQKLPKVTQTPNSILTPSQYR